MVLLLVVLRFILHKIFYFPPVKNSTPLHVLEIPHQLYRIPTHNNKSIQTILYGPQNSLPLVIGIHGYENTAEKLIPICQFLTTRGFRVLLVNTRNHGESDPDGSSTMVQFIQDLNTAILFARTNLAGNSKVILLGHSLGAATCLYVAAHDPGISAVVTIASFAALEQQLRQALCYHHFPAGLIKPVLRYLEISHHIKMRDLSPQNNIARIRVPILLLHGSQDPVVAAADFELLQSVAPEKLFTARMMEGENHSSLLDKPETFQLIFNFLEKNGLLK